MSIDQVELHEVAIATATRASETEWEGVHAWLDHAEVLLAAKRQYGYGGFGEWWSTMVGALPRAYSKPWRSILLRAAQRCEAEGRPEMIATSILGRFSLERWANGGDGWTTDERTEPDVDLDDEYDGPVDDDEPEAESAAVHGKDEWYTPGWLFHALGLTFDLDACSPADRTYVSVPAHKWYTEVDDGLAQRWHGLVLSLIHI